MIQREWSRKELISFPLCRQKDRDYVSERKKTMAKDLCMISRRPEALPERVSRRGNVTPASSGRVDGPAACAARRGPDGVRGVVDFCEPAKILDSPGLPTGDIPSQHLAKRQRTEPKHCEIRPTGGSVYIPVGRILGYHRVGGRQNIYA